MTQTANEANLVAHRFASVLKTDNSKLFNCTVTDVSEAQRQLRYAASLANVDYINLDLDNVYPMDLEEIFKSLPDNDGIIVISNYDIAHEYLVDLIDFTLEYYEYHIRLSYNKGIVPVSGKWRFVILNRPGFRFSPVLYRSLYHFNFD